MITKDQKKKLREVLKNGFPKVVQKHLTKKRIFNKRGNPYSVSSILDVMNGRFSNHEVEEVIMKLYLSKVEETKMIVQRRNEILGIKN